MDKQTRQKKQALDKLIASSEVLGDTLQKDTKLRAKQALASAKKVKKKNWAWMGGGVLLFIVALFVYDNITKPDKGSIGYGICRVFLELYVTYPDYLRISSARDILDDKGNIITRIWYSQIDGFGQSRMERIQCYYRRNEDKSLYLDKVTIGSGASLRDADPAIVKRFSSAFDSIRESELDLVLPNNFPDRIRNLKVDRNFGRKPLL